MWKFRRESPRVPVPAIKVIIPTKSDPSPSTAEIIAVAWALTYSFFISWSGSAISKRSELLTLSWSLFWGGVSCLKQLMWKIKQIITKASNN